MTIDEAKAEILEMFERSGLKPLPRAELILESYAAQVVRQRDARQRVTDEGEIVAGPRDQPITHPALAIEREATALISRLHRELLRESAEIRDQKRR